MKTENGEISDIFIDKGDQLIILIHGFMGSPYNFHFMSRFFDDKNYSIWIPYLMEHGKTNIYQNSLPIEWYEDLKNRTIQFLKGKEFKKIHIMGLSMGGMFALRLSVELSKIFNKKFDSLTLMATPYHLKKVQSFFMHLIGYKVLKMVYPYKKREESDIFHPLQKVINSRKKRVSIRLAFGLSYFLKECKPFIKKINIPTFIIHSKKDNTVPWRQAKYIFNSLKTKNKKLYILKNSFHILPLDIDRVELFEQISSFIKSV